MKTGPIQRGQKTNSKKAMLRRQNSELQLHDCKEGVHKGVVKRWWDTMKK